MLFFYSYDYSTNTNTKTHTATTTPPTLSFEEEPCLAEDSASTSNSMVISSPSVFVVMVPSVNLESSSRVIVNLITIGISNGKRSTRRPYSVIDTRRSRGRELYNRLYQRPSGLSILSSNSKSAHPVSSPVVEPVPLCVTELYSHSCRFHHLLLFA